jgi:hypothetical protein
MILIEQSNLNNEEPRVARMRAAVMECLPNLGHSIHTFSSADALAEYLEAGLDQMEVAGFGRGLRRVVLIHKTLAPVEAVAKRMAPGHEFVAWPEPDCWIDLYQNIADLRTRARAANPDFVPQVSLVEKVRNGMERVLRLRP